MPEGELLEYHFTLNDKTVDVTIEEPETDTYRITSTATADEDSSTTVEAYVAWVPTEGSGDSNWMDPEEYTEEETYDGGNFIVGPNEEHVGNVYVTNGNVELYENAVIDGNVYAANGNVQFKGTGALITGNVYSSGDTQLEISDSTIEGHVIAGGNVQLKLGSVIGGTACSEGGNIQLEDAETQILGSAYAKANIQVYKWAHIAGDAYAEGDVQTGDGGTIGGVVQQNYPYSCPLCGGGEAEYELDVLSYTIK